jgi:hypothetical protein
MGCVRGLMRAPPLRDRPSLTRKFSLSSCATTRRLTSGREMSHSDRQCRSVHLSGCLAQIGCRKIFLDLSVHTPPSNRLKNLNSRSNPSSEPQKMDTAAISTQMRLAKSLRISEEPSRGPGSSSQGSATSLNPLLSEAVFSYRRIA